MDDLGFRTPARLRAALVLLLLVATSARAAGDGDSCELKIQGHSIVQLTLIDKAGRSGVRLDHPGETVKLPAGEYRVEQVELEDGYVLNPMPGQRQDWFKVTPEGPNELVVGAPLYPTVTASRCGGFIQMDYDTVDGAGRSYRKNREVAAQRLPAPTFAVYRDGKEIGSGSFEYG